MPTYKLKYFNARGRAEASRWIFALAGVEYEDVRFESEEWKSIKPSTPFGQAPFLDVDGVLISQSLAIARFLGNEFGLVASTNVGRARGDMIAETTVDLLTPLFAVFSETDEEKKKAILKSVQTEKAPALLANFEKLLKENGSGDGYFVGDKATWSDLYFVTHVRGFLTYIASLGNPVDMAPYPKVDALLSRVEALPQIAAWIAKRPVTQN